MSEYSIFPKAIDGYAQLPLTVDRVTSVSAEGINRLRSAIINIENSIGVMPQGEYESLSDRLEYIIQQLILLNEEINNLEINNFKIGVIDEDLTQVSLNHDTIPSAKAAKEYVDATFSINIIEVTDLTYNATNNDDIILVNQTLNAMPTINLPAGNNHKNGRITIKDKKGTASSFGISLVAYGSESIDGENVYIIFGDYSSRQLVFLNNEWSII